MLNWCVSPRSFRLEEVVDPATVPRWHPYVPTPEAVREILNLSLPHRQPANSTDKNMRNWCVSPRSSDLWKTLTFAVEGWRWFRFHLQVVGYVAALKLILNVWGAGFQGGTPPPLYRTGGFLCRWHKKQSNTTFPNDPGTVGLWVLFSSLQR
jgi:hypothetical protein